MVTLDELRATLPPDARASVAGDGSRRVRAVTHDSRAVVADGMFACLRGSHHDGHRFADEAVAAGAASLLVDHPLGVESPSGVPINQLVVTDTRAALGPVASAVYGDPSTALRVVGVTGTNGKTTTCALLGSILRAAGDATGVIGTLSGARTTPEAPDLQAALAEMVHAGERSAVLEVSSHALALRRVDGTRFDAAVFTNLGRDHLDLHGDLETYFAAKASLFRPDKALVGVVNADDEFGRRLLERPAIELVPYSHADARDVTVTAGSVHFTWHHDGGRIRLDVPIGGAFNVMNALAAATTAAVCGIGTDAIVAGLAAAPPVPGRFERVRAAPTAPQCDVPGFEVPEFEVIVDYAHTPDGLEELIAAAGGVVAEGARVIVVFGAGGDRDRDKRPAMGEVAARLADLAIITSDNPRGEDPAAIIEAVAAGVAAADADRVEAIVDRTRAIERAVSIAEPGDVVVIAGKGHERTQTIGGRVLDLDDRAVAAEALAARTRPVRNGDAGCSRPEHVR